MILTQINAARALLTMHYLLKIATLRYDNQAGPKFLLLNLSDVFNLVTGYM